MAVGERLTGLIAWPPSAMAGDRFVGDDFRRTGMELCGDGVLVMVLIGVREWSLQWNDSWRVLGE